MEIAVTHAIFDMDGLLLDTEKLYTTAHQRVLDPFGMEFTFDLKAKLMGMKSLESCEKLISLLQLEDKISAEKLLEERDKVLAELFPNSELMPGVERLINHLKDKGEICLKAISDLNETKSFLAVQTFRSGVPMCVATSSSRHNYDIKVAKHKKLFGLFDFIVTGDDVICGKPNPEIFQTAAKKFPSAPQPQFCLVFEDSKAGVQAAQAAGMHVCYVPDPKVDEVVTLDVPPTIKIFTLEDFCPENVGLPAY